MLITGKNTVVKTKYVVKTNQIYDTLDLKYHWKKVSLLNAGKGKNTVAKTKSVVKNNQIYDTLYFNGCRKITLR